jgi:hypothetical protein
MSLSEKPTAPFALSLIGGILMVLSGAVLGAFGPFLSSIIGPIRIGRSFIYISGILYALTGLKVILGIIVIIAAVLLYSNPVQKTLWGVIILVLSIISIVLAGPVSFIGSVLGIVGGALALTWKPTKGALN